MSYFLCGPNEISICLGLFKTDLMILLSGAPPTPCIISVTHMNLGRIINLPYASWKA